MATFRIQATKTQEYDVCYDGDTVEDALESFRADITNGQLEHYSFDDVMVTDVHIPTKKELKDVFDIELDDEDE